MQCNRCGTNNPDGSEHCFNCGGDLGAPLVERSFAASPTATTKESASRLVAQVDIAGTTLVITEKEIAFGKQSLKCDDVLGIRYGIYKHYINGIRDQQSYAIWLKDARSTMFIECAKGLFVGSSTIESRYQETLKALYQVVTVPILQSLLINLDKGPGFQIGNVTFDRNGLHRSDSFGAVRKGLLHTWVSLAGGRSVEEREQRYQLLPWSEYGGYSFGEGTIQIYRKKEEWVRFALRDIWNAVCLGPLFNFLCEGNRLRSFVNI
jgi:hypothetical protein